MVTKNKDLPYALAYQNGNVYSIYTTFDDTQIIFYWNEKDQSQHKHPIIRDSKKILPDCYIKTFGKFGCKIVLWGIDVEFKFDHNRRIKDERVVWHGPIIDTTDEWSSDPNFHNNSPTSQGVYNGVYNSHYSEQSEID